MKDFTKRIENELLTDNTKTAFCRQCTLCRFWGNDPTNFWQNKPDKAYCDKYPYPESKPRGIMYDTEPCPYREARHGSNDQG